MKTVTRRQVTPASLLSLVTWVWTRRRAWALSLARGSSRKSDIEEWVEVFREPRISGRLEAGVLTFLPGLW